MPLYVYSCPECDVLLEELRPVGATDWPPVECPVCHGLCEMERTSVTVTGKHGPLDASRVAEETDTARQADPVAVVHGPGCPCCRTA